MSNPKKIYLSPEYPDSGRLTRDWASDQVESDWVEYVSADEIEGIIEKIDYEVDNEIESDMYILTFLKGVSIELKKLIEK